MSDSGAGPAVAGFVVIGTTYLLVEAIVSFFVLGFALGVVTAVAILGYMITYMVRHPIHNGPSWLGFIISGGTLLAIPFFVMYLGVMHGHTEVASNQMSGVQDVLAIGCFAALMYFMFSGVPRIYQAFERASRR